MVDGVWSNASGWSAQFTASKLPMDEAEALLSTGQSVAPEGHSIPTYPVRLEDDASISVGMEGMAKTLFSNDDF